MTDPLLSYQTPAPAANTGLRTATWIYLLVLGILYALGGLCAVASMAFVFTLLTRAGPAGATPGVGAIMLVTGIIMLLISLAIGATFIWAALRLRRGSRAAAITALVISILGTAGCLAIVGLGIIGALTSPDRDPGMLIGILFYLLPAAVNAVAVVLLIALMRQQRHAAYSVTM